MREDVPDSEAPRSRPGSVFDNLKPFVWSDQESVAYEVARDAIGEVVGVCSSKIGKESAKPQPDQDVIDAWYDEIRQWVGIRRTLDPVNHDQIARIRREARVRAQALRPRQIP